MAKSRRRTVSTTPAGASKSGLSPLLIGVVVIAAVLVVAGLIFLGNQTRGGPAVAQDFDFGDFPTKGDPDAPVTFIDFSNYG